MEFHEKQKLKTASVITKASCVSLLSEQLNNSVRNPDQKKVFENIIKN